MKFTRLTVFVAALACGLALSACGKKPDDGIASAGQNPTDQNKAATEVSSDPQERARQFAKCMRDQGVEMADPTFGENGEVQIQIGGAPTEGGQGIDPTKDRAKLEEAHKACQQYLPSGGEMMKANPEMEAKLREFAKCMRENGVENFPDPNPDGGGLMIGGPGSDLDPGDPTFQAAEQKCQEFAPFKRSTSKVESK